MIAWSFDDDMECHGDLVEFKGDSMMMGIELSRMRI